MHSQNGAWENDESRERGSNRVTEKTTLVAARLQSVKDGMHAH
jgi:GDP-D-mannose dehydratase